MLNAEKSKIKVLADLASVKGLISGIYVGILAVSKPGKRSERVLPGLIHKDTNPIHEASIYPHDLITSPNHLMAKRSGWSHLLISSH